MFSFSFFFLFIDLSSFIITNFPTRSRAHAHVYISYHFSMHTTVFPHFGAINIAAIIYFAIDLSIVASAYACTCRDFTLDDFDKWRLQSVYQHHHHHQQSRVKQQCLPIEIMFFFVFFSKPKRFYFFFFIFFLIPFLFERIIR